MDFDDAITTGLLTMKEGFEGEMRPDTIQIGVADEKGFRTLTEEQIADHLDSLS